MDVSGAWILVYTLLLMADNITNLPKPQQNTPWYYTDTLSSNQ